MTEDTIQNIRDSIRPFLTIWFSTLFAVVIIIGILGYGCNCLNLKEAVMAVGTPLGTIMGYHFGKKATIDRNVTSSPYQKAPTGGEKTPKPKDGAV